MKKLFLLFFLVFAFGCQKQTQPIPLFRQTENVQSLSWVNIVDFGAIPNGGKSAIDINTDAFKKAIKAINESNDKGVIYIPAGTYIIKSLSSYADNIDFRYCNFQGDGMRKSIIRLADNENKPIIETNLFFECYFKDLMFFGNQNNNPEAESLIHFSGGNVYTISFDRVYFRDFGNTGLFIEGGQLFNLDNVQAKYGGDNSVALHFKDVLSVTVNHPDIEQNHTGIVVECTSPKSYRYKNSFTYIRNPYLEKNDVGIHLKGISNVTVEGGYNSEGLFAKLSASEGGSYSCYNNFIGQPLGQIEIDEGCFGNSFFGFSASSSGIIDNDGRNKGELYKWDYTSKNFNGSPSFVDLSTNPVDLEIRNPSNGYNSANKSNGSYLGGFGKDASENISHLRFTSKSSEQNGNIFLDLRKSWKPTTTYYLYVLGNIDMNAQSLVRVYDLSSRQYYNWFTGKFESGIDSYYFDLEIPSYGGGIKGYKIPIEIDSNDNRVIRLQYFVESVTDIDSVSELYYFMLSEDDNLGMLHYRNGLKIGEGL